MALFSNLLSRIWGHADTAAPTAASPGEAPAATPSAAVPDAAPAAAPTAAPATPAPSAAPVDVAAVLNGLAATQAERLDWHHSIVDLLKLVGLDSSLAARKELATDLGYTGALDGSAAMNLWLHKAVMKKLAENGGKVPQELLD
jgi:3-oxoacyl-ACP reductase-like protein